MINNAPVYGVSALVLILWDIVDFYTENARLDFLLVGTFWVYYLTRLGFSIVVLEGTLALGLFNVSNPFLVALFVPFGFVILLQNLLVRVGGETGVDFGEVFARFRRVAIDGLFKRQASHKAALRQRLYDSGASIDDLRHEYSGLSSPQELEGLEKVIEQKSDDHKRLYLSVAIIDAATPDYVSQIVRKYASKASAKV